MGGAIPAGGSVGADLGHLVGDFLILAGMGAVLAVLAIWAFGRTERYARRGGRLAQY